MIYFLAISYQSSNYGCFSFLKSLKNNQFIIHIIMKDSQQIAPQNITCKNCQTKEEALSKCMHLITLLKKKVARSESSKIKNSQSVQSHTMRSSRLNEEPLKGKCLSLVLRTLERGRIVSAFHKICAQSISNKQQTVGIIDQQQTQNKQLALTADNLQFRVQEILKTNNLPFPHSYIFQSIQSSKKNQLKNQFGLTLQNKRLTQRVKFLQQQLQDTLKRQEKEVAKKRQSLSGLVEELSEKNEIIEDLKSSIRHLESKLGAKENGILQVMLQQDSEALRKVVYRLENINDKLNNELAKVKKEKSQLQLINKQLIHQIGTLKVEVKQLKEQNFDLEHKELNVEACKKEVEFVSRKVIEKVENIRKLQKRWNGAIRSRSDIKNGFLQNTYESKLTKKGSAESIDQTAHQELQQKLESVFIYLFHIHDITFKLGFAELFDEQEKDLLSAHRQKYLQKGHHQSFIMKKKSTEEEREDFGNSLMEAFNDLQTKQTKGKVNPKVSEMQCQKLIQKISELKERNLYVRNVLLSLLKSLQLKSMKKQTQGILTMLSDYFQYSQDERIQIFQTKSKKLFGFI